MTHSSPSATDTKWIWICSEDPRPANRFTWFRRVVHLDTIPATTILRFAADSTARLWVNGIVVRRKVARFDEPHVRAEVVDVAGLLRPGPNVVVALHHSWGDILTFQRSGAEHAGLWLNASWVRTDAEWRWLAGEEFAVTAQFRGVHDHTPRIRYPIDWDTRLSPAGLHEPDFAVDDWLPVEIVTGGPWPERVPDVETPGQREVVQRPGGVVAAGTASHTRWSGEPTDRPSLLAQARVRPDPTSTAAAAGLVTGEPVTIAGSPGMPRYVTVDFQRPVHGFPLLDLELDRGTAEVRIGYGELVTSPYDGTTHARADGWIDVDGVVATGYADRVVISPGRQAIELPDERTARWVTVHLTCTDTAALVLHQVAMVTSQYPTRPVGSFVCGDEQIEQVVKLCLVHAELTMTDTYVDTPGREDGQWIEDAHPRALVAARWFDDIRLRRFMIRTLAEGQDEAGELHPFFPSNYPARPAPYDWAVQWIGMLYDDYQWTEDAAFVATYAPTLIRLWDAVLAHLGPDGLWRTGQVLGDVRVSLRPGQLGSSGPITPWVIERLRWSAGLARVIGDLSHAAQWETAANAMTLAFRKHHLVRDHPNVPAIVADRWEPETAPEDRGFSQAGQAAGLLDGLLTASEAAALIDYAFPAPDAAPPYDVSRWNTPTWCYRVLTALSDHGHATRAVAHLRERFAPYLPGHPHNPTPLALQGPYGGPLPEYWLSRADLGVADGQPNPAQPSDPTGSHGWGAVPLLWLHECLLGVTVDVPGGAKITVRPDTAGLPYVAGWTVTPRGPVHVHLDPQQRVLRIILPPQVAARVHVPASLGHQLWLTGPDATPQPLPSAVLLDAPGTWTVAPAT